MARTYTPEMFDELLATHKKNREFRNNYKAPDYRTFVPMELKTDWKPEAFYEDQQQGIVDRSRARTEIVLQKARNQAAYQAMIAARRAKERARRHAIAVQNNPNVFGNPNAGPVFTGGSIGPGGRFKDPTPGLGNVGTHNVVSTNWHGRTLTLNPRAMNNFVGFLNALTRTGYKIHSLGSHNIRNIAGTNTLSLHSYGLAIDINPSQNPVTSGHVVTNLPPGVGALAAKYGLKWGGAWQGSKKDAMHFSIPWGGRM